MPSKKTIERERKRTIATFSAVELEKTFEKFVTHKTSDNKKKERERRQIKIHRITKKRELEKPRNHVESSLVLIAFD